MKLKILGLFAAALILTGCREKGNSVDLIPAGNRQMAPEIKASFINASNGLSLAQMKGKVVVLDFWATWCGPCRMEIPSLVKLYNAYHSKGLELWGLSVEANDGQPNEYFTRFISNDNMQYPVGLAATDTLKAYGINPIPTTVFIDKSGRVALAFVGVHSEEDLTGAIEKLLAE